MVIVPRTLREGDRVAIVSPAGAVRPAFVYGAIPVLRAQGWEPYVAPHALGCCGTYSGTVEERLWDMRQALLDPTVRAILCSRGGYGAVQLLEGLSQLNLRADPKWLIGFSDITALHGLMASQGVASLHGPMARYLSDMERGGAFGSDAPSRRATEGVYPPHVGNPCGQGGDVRLGTATLLTCAQGAGREGAAPLHLLSHLLNRPGTATAPLYGGNLSVMSGLIGTPYDLIRPGCILFIEDINEPPYKTERTLWQLRLSGVLGTLKGLIVGQFTGADQDETYRRIAAVIAPYSFPVAFNAPVGHIPETVALIEGLPVTLTCDASGVTLTYLSS